MRTLSVAKDYSRTPGTRYKKDGPHSGEVFRETLLIPFYKEDPQTPVLIELDGVEGFPPSFLDEAFGGFARLYGHGEALRFLQFRGSDSVIIAEIRRHIDRSKRAAK